MPTNLATSGPRSREDIRHVQEARLTRVKKKVLHDQEIAAPVLKPDTILIIDSRALIRDCFARCLKATNQNWVVHAFASVSELKQAGLLRSLPTAIILCNQGHGDAVEREFALLSEIAPGTPVVIISEAEGVDEVLAALDRGARGYIPTSVTLDVAIEALRLIEAGGTFVPASCLTALRLNSRLKDEAAVVRRAPTVFRLTPRQAAVLEALRLGKANKQIAYELNMREGTVKAHVRDIMKRLNARNRTEVAILANRANFSAGNH
jgi:DNA-binding NarL/FixJ family response regulator